MTFPCRLSVAALAASSFAFLAGAPQVMADVQLAPPVLVLC
jgi:hypothetical protein